MNAIVVLGPKVILCVVCCCSNWFKTIETQVHGFLLRLCNYLAMHYLFITPKVRPLNCE